METSLFFDREQRGFYRADGTATCIQSVLEGCNPANLCVVAGAWREDGEFYPVDLADYNVSLTFGRRSACAQEGEIKVTVGDDSTAEISPSISAKDLTTALNALASVTDAGGLDVKVSAAARCSSDELTGCTAEGAHKHGGVGWDIMWRTTGDKPAIEVDATCLWPPVVATVTTHREGDADCAEVVQVSLREGALAYTAPDDWTGKEDSAFTITDVQVGGAGENAVKRITIDPAAVGGTFGLQIGSEVSEAISVYATATELLDALVNPGDYGVSKPDAFTWELTYFGDTEAHDDPVVVCNAVRSSKGATALFNLNTIPLDYLLNKAEQVTGSVELVLEEIATGAVCRYEEALNVHRGMLDVSQPPAAVGVFEFPSSRIGAYDGAAIPGFPGGTLNDLLAYLATVSGGVTDHGALNGLGDDDHPQYHNESRANTWLGTKTSDDITEGSVKKFLTAGERAAIASNTSAISTESTARENADDALQLNIESEESARLDNDNILDQKIDDLTLADLDTTVTGGELDSDHAKLALIEAEAKDDQTGPEIKTLLEAIANTNFLTDTEQGNIRTTEQLQDAIAAMFQGGTHTSCTVTYDDGTGTIDIAVTGGAQLTQEEVEDMVGNVTTQGTGINVDYDDANDVLTISLTGESYTTAEKNKVANVPADTTTELAGKQASNANLAAEAGLTGAADKVSYYTGLGAKALATLTSYGRTLMGLANKAAVQTELEINTTQVNDYLFDDGVHTLTSSSGVATPDANNGHTQKFPLTENVTDFNTPSNLADGESMRIDVLQDSTPRTLTLDAAWKIMGSGVAANIGSATNGQLIWLSISRYGSNYYISINAEA